MSLKLQVWLQGETVGEGSIPLPLLSHLTKYLQIALEKVAQRLAQYQTRSVQPSPLELRVSEFVSGSFGFSVTPAIVLNANTTLPDQAIEQFVRGLETLRRDDLNLPYGYSIEVLAALRQLGKLIKTKQLTQIIFEIESSAVNPAVYDRQLHRNVNHLYQIEHYEATHTERIDAVRGQLTDVNMERYSAHMQVGQKWLKCTFDDDTAEIIPSLLQQPVYAIGIAAYRNSTGELHEFHIKQIFVLNSETSESDLEQALQTYRIEHDTAAEFKESFKQALRGETVPIETLWERLDDEERSAH